MQRGNLNKKLRPSRAAVQFAKAVLPPIARAVLVELRNHGTLRFFGKIFTGTFSSFDDVSRSFRGAVPYHSRESELEEIARAQSVREAVRDARRGIAPEPADRYTLLSALVATVPGSSPVILDVGGGMGDTLPHLIYSCPKKNSRLLVHELAPVVEAGRTALEGEEAIVFVDSIDRVVGPVDIVFMGSSLQYFEDYKSLVGRIAALRPGIFVIAHTPMTDAPTFVTAQVNMRRRVMPNIIVNRSELTALMHDLGFALIHRSESSTAAHFRNFPAPHNQSSFTNMAFLAQK